MNTLPLAPAGFITGLCLLLAACAATPPTEQPAPDSGESLAVTLEQPLEEEYEAPLRPFPADSFHDLLVAEFAVRRNRFDLALGNYMQQSHQTRDPGVVARATRLAQFLKADNATLDAATLWTEVEPDNAEGQYTLATMLAKQGRPLEALQHMVKVLEEGGKTNFPAIAASSLQLDESVRQQLEQQFDALIKQYPDNTQLLTAKSLLLQQRGDSEQALATIRQSLKIQPQNLQAIIVEARLLQQLGRGDEALTRLEQVVSSYPHNRRLRLQYARMLMNKDLEAAKRQFDVLLSATPNDADLLLSLGLISKELGQLGEAEGYFQRLLDSGERTTEAHFYLGQLEEQSQNWQAAIEHYQQIPPGDDYLTAVSRIASLYVQQGRTETARSYIRSVREEHPEHSVRLYLLESEVLLKTRDYDAGYQLLTEALLLHPKQVNLLYTRSMFSEQNRQYELMEQDLETILELEPDNPVALNALGYILANRSERLDEAYQMIRHALSLKPNDPAILDSLGWVEFRRGNLAQALQFLGQAFQAYPDHEVAAHLGEVLWTVGEEAQAKIIWQQGLKNKPDSPIILETLQRLDVEQPLPALPDTGDDTES